MMSDMNYISQINSSGFPFQLGVENEIKSKAGEHGWRVSATEYKWRDPDSGRDGFIDIVLEKSENLYFTQYIIIECKRMKEGSLIFLSKQKPDKTYDAILMAEAKSNHGSIDPHWEKYAPDPRTYVSKYCTVPGQSDRGTPMLERLCDSLLLSTECVADELHRSIPSPSQGVTVGRLYIPAIVINTELKLCKFKYSDVDLEKGELDDKKVAYETVPYLRFQKSFSTKYRLADVGRTSLRDIEKSNQRTVFVINAMRINEFLRAWSTE